MRSVVEVCRAMGREPDKRTMWSVGDVMQKRFATRMGRQPDVELRPKTYADGGTQYHAVYPEEWWREIEEEIRKHATEEAKQGNLF